MINIIAEIGLNHNGNLNLAKDMIKIASTAGADVCKFQLNDPLKRPDIDNHKWKDVLIESKITRRQVFELKQACDDNNIDFLASVFDVERVKWCEDIEMKVYKIASKCIYDRELAKAIVATEKPVILSYGMFKESEIPSIVIEWFNGPKRAREINVTKMYCISEYPAPLESINFMYTAGRELGVMDLTFTVPVAYSIFESDFQGYSDHTIGLTACKAAMSLGARVIEKHFTTDKGLPGPDHIHSCTPDELSELCRFRDDIERILY